MSNQSLDLLNYFFYPKSVAIVGISRRKPSLGQLILDNLEITEYQGDIFLLNPKSEEIRGYKCYNKLEDLPSVPDLVLILIPPRFVKGIVESCIRLGIKAVTIISAGFSEASKEGALLEEEIGTVLRGNAIRIIGPNSMGTYSYRAHASFSPIPIDKGNIGFLSQSGSIVVALLEHLRVHGLGFSKFISLGNQLDVNLNHGIDYLKNDNDTQVITSYVESIPEVEPFRTLVTGISSSKPVLMVKSGRSEAGARAASSHTGALAGENRLVDALLASVGVIRASNIKELAILSRIFLKYNQLSGFGIALVSSAGGPGIIATDEVYEKGLKLASLTDGTKKRLAEIVPPAGNLNNPVDIIADADVARHVDVTKILVEDENVAAIIVIVVHPVLIGGSDLILELNKIETNSKPVIICYTGPQYTNYSNTSQLIVTETTQHAVQMLSSLYSYTQWKLKYSHYNSILQEYLNRDKIETLTSDNTIISDLEQVGFLFPATRECDSLDEIKEFRKSLNSSVVMKISHPQFSHKTDVGGVYLNLNSTTEIEDAYSQIEQIYNTYSVEDPDRKYEVQKYYSGGIELVLGIFHDAHLGDFLMVGIGGTLVEIMEDIQFHPLPVTSKVVKDMLMSLKMKKLLQGYRNSAPVNIDNLCKNITSFSQIAQRHNVQEMDINPLLIFPKTNEYVILDLRFEVKQ